MFINLQCKNCENIKCPIETLAWIDKEGCSREISEEVAEQYEHYINEIIPFWKLKSNSAIDKEYNKILDFLYTYIYKAPIGQKIDKDGKIDIKQKWKNLIASFNLGTIPVENYTNEDSDFSKKLAELF